MTALAAAVSAAIWVYLLLARGEFWRVREKVLPQGQGRVANVAVIIPARDEADVIGRAVMSLLKQDTRESLRVFVIDDGSTDGTAEAALQAARACGEPGRLTVIAGRDLPAGWSGKLWAVQQGIEAALKTKPDFLLLTDADIEHATASVASLVSAAERHNADLTSVMVRLHCGTAPERLLIPAFVYFFFQLYPPKWIEDLSRTTAGAAGGCMLVRPEALAKAGGIAAISHEIIDDCALARAVKRSGGRVWLGMAAETRSIRPYTTFSEIGLMISRSAFNQLRHSTLLLLLTLLGLGLTYLAPLMLALTQRGWPLVLGAAAWAAMTASYLPMVRFYRLSALWALTLPIAAIFYAGATVHSAIRYWAGAGGQWKGRAQDPARV